MSDGKKGLQGFASMDREQQRAIASKGGKAAHEQGTAHEWTSDQAREAGRKGGLNSHRKRKEHLAELQRIAAEATSTGDDKPQG